MKPKLSALTLALGGTLAAFAALASEGEERQQLSQLLVDRWGGHVEEVHQQPASDWSDEMTSLLQVVPMDDLRKAASARHFNDMNDALLGKAPVGDDGGAIQTFGDIGTELVFVPVTPCRIIDTRLANGPIAAGTVRSFDVTSVESFAFQGGAAGNCGIGAAGSFAAAVINFTVVAPAADGYITAFPFGGVQPLASTLNYEAGAIRGNLATVRLDQAAWVNEMSVFSFAQTHLVADVVGYFTRPSMPPLECVETAQNTINIPAGDVGNAFAPACAAGYTMTATNCRSGSWEMPLNFQAAGACSAKNQGGGSAPLRASRTCCRTLAP